MNVKSFVVLTTHNLPEAFFLVDFLVKRRQHVALVNFQGRPARHNLNVIKRLWKRRGTLYILDFFLGKLLRPYVIPGRVLPFPDITPAAIQSYIQTLPYFESHDLHDQETLRISSNALRTISSPPASLF